MSLKHINTNKDSAKQICRLCLFHNTSVFSSIRRTACFRVLASSTPHPIQKLPKQTSTIRTPSPPAYLNIVS